MKWIIGWVFFLSIAILGSPDAQGTIFVWWSSRSLAETKDILFAPPEKVHYRWLSRVIDPALKPARGDLTPRNGLKILPWFATEWDLSVNLREPLDLRVVVARSVRGQEERCRMEFLRDGKAVLVRTAPIRELRHWRPALEPGRYILRFRKEAA